MLETEQLIKIILGIIVVVAVVAGVFFVFKDRVIEFFKSLSPEDITQIFVVLIK